MAEELGLDYEHIPLEWDDPRLKELAFLKINPAGRIPAIEHDGFALSESLAINVYLAKAAGSDLYPATLQDEARLWSWCLWAMFDLEAPLESLRRHRVLLPEAERQPAIADEAEGRIAAALPVLDRALAPEPYLLGQAFSVADLNLASVLSPSRTVLLELDPFPAVIAWLERCRGRPAWQAARFRHQAG